MTYLLAMLCAAQPSFTPEERFGHELDVALASTRDVYNVPRALVLAVIRQESNFDPEARSPAGAIGLMQVMPSTALKVGVQIEDLRKPAQNILAGVRLLAVLLEYYRGDLLSVLSAYNARPRELYAPIPWNSETPTYVARVLRFYELYRHQDQHLSSQEVR